jgi:hypothetical protein
MPSGFELPSEITNIESIAIGTKIRELHLLEKRFGRPLA